jgi:hypothetical protein
MIDSGCPDDVRDWHRYALLVGVVFERTAQTGI